MRTVGPYTLLGPLGTCQVGDAWSGRDENGGPVTVAVLNARASADQRWRDAFAATATALAQAQVDRLPIVAADFRAEAPWVACLPERGPGAAQIFLALGQTLRGPDAEPEPERYGSLDAPTMALPALNPRTLPAQRPPAEPGYDGSPAPTSPYYAEPASGAPSPYYAEPASSPPSYQRPAPTSAAPSPYYAEPAPARYYATPSSAPPTSGAPARSPYDPPAPTGPVGPVGPGAPTSPAERADRAAPAGERAYPPLVMRPPSELRKEHQKARRTLILATIGALLLGLALGVGGTLALRGGGDDDGQAAGAPTPSASSAPPLDPALPSAPPARPGVEPPRGGGWPVRYPSFAATEPTTKMDLDGFGFAFQVPAGWQCEPRGRTSGSAAYDCFGKVAGLSVGGDVVVRACEPCPEERRDEWRTQEEAWGLPWIRSGPFATFAEGAGVANGRSGLVYLQYWRSDKDGVIDRQLVLRMIAPPGQEDVVRKVVNSIRAVTFTI